MTDLVAALDIAAAKLLEQAGLGSTTPEKIEATPAERVKVFDSILEYAKMRADLIPKEAKESAFDRITKDFHGDKAERRGRPRKDKAAPDSVGDVEPVNGHPTPGVDLFDA